MQIQSNVRRDLGLTREIDPLRRAAGAARRRR